MPCDVIGRSYKFTAACNNNIPSANSGTFACCPFSRQGVLGNFITVLLFYPRYIFHRHLLTVIFLTTVL